MKSRSWKPIEQTIILDCRVGHGIERRSNHPIPSFPRAICNVVGTQKHTRARICAWNSQQYHSSIYQFSGTHNLLKRNRWHVYIIYIYIYRVTYIYIPGLIARFARALAHAFSLWSYITEWYYRIISRVYRIILQNHITEWYHGIISRNHITEWYNRNILQNYITQSYDGIMLRKYIVEWDYRDTLQQIPHVNYGRCIMPDMLR